MREGKMIHRFLVILFVLLGLGAFQTPAVADTFGRFAFVANPTDSTISVYTVSIYSGRLRHLGFTTALFNPNSVATTPDGNFLYAVNGSVSNVQGYSISLATGALTSLGTTGTGTNPSGIAMDPLGRF